MPKAIITGSAGFLGQHIAFEMEQHGWEIAGIDKQYSNWHDLRFPEIVTRVFEEHSNADLCIHLAAKVGRLFGEDDPMETLNDNVGMTALVAQACGKHKIRLAFASTSEIYGDNGEAICQEVKGPFTRPHNLYGLSKVFAEDVCAHYAPKDLLLFRFSMPYGPGLPAGRGRAAIINVLHQALHRKQIPIHIGAERSWCYVGDTARAVRMIVESKKRAGAWNIGRDSDPILMLDVAHMACDLTDAPDSLIEQIPAPAMQTVVKRLSTKKLEDIGWKPEIELWEGMSRTLAWVKTLDETGAIAA